ncbi:MAG: exodeoxyribonuclease III [Chloroflexi bacterium]|nr:exodeoxyribonuclease III [Chloroflexota bacterium]
MRLVSWNVNGIRAAVGKGLLDWMQSSGADAVCLQETKANADVLPNGVLYPPEYQSYWATCEKKGYSGVATYTRGPVNNWVAGFGVERFDCEGRVVVTDMGDFDLYNIYFPNGQRGGERLTYKLEFYDAFLDHVNAKVAGGRPVIFCGDVNTAHREIDLARPKENRKTSGFMPVECAVLDRWLEHGWVDSFRHLYPDTREAYSWWDQRVGARARNVGWRIDYFFVHESLISRVKDAGISPDVMGSDHCPVWLELGD